LPDFFKIGVNKIKRDAIAPIAYATTGIGYNYTFSWILLLGIGMLGWEVIGDQPDLKQGAGFIFSEPNR
jgi:hypothetical protein